MIRIARTFFWEFIQNLPLTAGFIGGMRFWDRNPWGAFGCMIAGSATSALLIAFTEPKIVAGHRESTRTVLGNILAFSALTVALVAYLQAGWSRWETDILAGGCAGFILDRVQSRGPLGRHTLALTGAGACGLPLVRLFTGIPNWPISVLILTGVITLIVVIFDYAGQIQ